MIQALSDPATATIIAAALAFVGGLLRGYTGFGLPQLMAPFFVLIYGPGPAIAVICIVDFFVSAMMLPQVWRHRDAGQLAPVIVASAIGVPIGTALLVAADPDLVRRAMGAAICLFAVTSLAGWRYRGPRGVALAGAAGALSGVLGGLTSIAGPPVIMYWLGGPDPVARVRANLVIYFTVLVVFIVAAAAVAGSVTPRVLTDAVWLTPCALIGTALGMALFHPTREVLIRRVALLVFLLGGLTALLR